MQIEIKKLSDGQVEIIGEIPAGDFESERAGTIKKLSEGASIPGFRPGKVPEKVLIEKIGESALLEEMAQTALSKAYPKILKDNKINAIGRPEISITKIASGNPLGFKIKAAVLPDIEILDWESIAKEIMSKEEIIKVEDKEIDEAIENIRKMRAQTSDVKDRNGKTSDVEKEPVLPKLNDEFVKGLGGFKNVEDFKQKIRENIKSEKEMRAKEIKRIKVLEGIIEKTKIEIPLILIESEKEKMLAEMKASISQMGMGWEDYLKHLKKTEDELRTAWNTDAKKRVSHGLVLRELAIIEKVSVSTEEIDKEVEKIVGYYKIQGQKIEKDRVREYALGLIQNEKVFKLMEETVRPVEEEK